MEYIENLHRGYDGYNIDFEINDLQADMIAGIVSYKVGVRLSYDDISILDIRSTNNKIVGRVLVNLNRLVMEFTLNLPDWLVSDQGTERVSQKRSKLQGLQ